MRLIVKSGYHRGQEFSAVKARMILGRHGDCDIQLFDEGISRQHAEITSSNGKTVIRDLGSRNGTLVQGQPISEETTLSHGDEIILGQAKLVLLHYVKRVDPPTPNIEEQATKELSSLTPSPSNMFEEFRMMGRSEAMEKLLKKAAKVAASNVSVLVLGETGTGKELVAEGIHRLSPRKNKPFKVLNCAAIPANLIEAELFGYLKGAFTGAVTNQKGYLEAADGGTLFLDELGEMPLTAQASLLRFLQSGEVKKIGSTETKTVDVRIISATHRDLNQMISEKLFREDLFFRLQVVELKLPALRERGDDRELIAAAALERFSEGRKMLSKESLALIRSYDWPGNVRQLLHAIESANVLADGSMIEVEDFPSAIRPSEDARPSSSSNEAKTLKDIEKQAIRETLERYNGHRTKSAEALGIDRKTLYSKIKEYGL